MTEAALASSEATEHRDGRSLGRDLGLPGRTAVTWAMAGGVLAGGMVTAFLTLTGRLSGFGLIKTSTILFLFGVGFGFLHGAVLGWLGRPPDSAGGPEIDVRTSLGRGALYAVLGTGFAWVLAGWISQTTVALYLDRILAYGGVALAWAGGLALCLWAGVNGWRALRNAYRRWEDPVLGTVLVGLVFLALLLVFLADRPEIWGTRIRVGGMGAFLLAGGVTVWISGPGISLPLYLHRRLPDPPGMSPPFPGMAGSGTSLLLAVPVGLGLGALLLWLAPLSADTLASSAVPVALSRALVDEVLLRLFVVTCSIWVLRRWHPLHPEEVAVIAVVLGALAGLAINGPGILSVGFPDAGALWGHLTLGLFFPGLAFGALFVRWGFVPAAVAHGSMAVLLTLTA